MSDRLLDALTRHFGHPDFRGPQRAVCEHVLRGGSGLLLLPTGDGKSLCYQLPALLFDDALTLVVSPLIALMDDQVAALRRRDLPADCIHSMLEAHEREARLEAAVSGKLKLLYCTPERFRVPGFLDRIRHRRIALLAVDEAHCLSQWGHDFRPDYAKLGEIRAALGDPPTLALTATATPTTASDIKSTLRIADSPTWHSGLERKNLFLSVTEVAHADDKLTRLRSLLERIEGAGIVYFALIGELRKVEDRLRRDGHRPLVYHGDLSASERREQQARFLTAPDAIMLATNAFGMGVDKPDIRFVVHWQMPRTLEAYYQEIGRAGRDGEPAFCELLFLRDDLQIQREFTDGSNPDAAFLTRLVETVSTLGERAQAFDRDDLSRLLVHGRRHDGRVDTCLRLLRTAGCLSGELGTGSFLWLRTPTAAEIAAWLPPGKHAHDLQALLATFRYGADQGCRKSRIHDYFGLPHSFPAGCGACDQEIESDTHIEANFAPRGGAPRAHEPASAGADVARGDWVHIAGLGLCTVLRVHRHSRGVRIDVERASDLTERSVDLSRVRWRRVES